MSAGTYALHGNAAYPLFPYLRKGFQGNQLTPAQQEFNTTQMDFVDRQFNATLRKLEAHGGRCSLD